MGSGRSGVLNSGRVPATLLTLVLLVGASFAAAPQSAAIACDQLFTDPEGDASNTAPGGDEENVPNLDIISGGIAHETATHFTTQIKVKNLSMDFPPNANASINWYFQWTFDGVDYFSRTRVDSIPGNTAVYSFGTYEPPRYVTIDATTGSFNPGENGTVQVDVPLEAVGAPLPGTAMLTQVYAVASIGQGIPGASQLVTRVDRGPDGEAYGTDYPLGNCQGTGGGLRSPRARLRVKDETPERGSMVAATAWLKECPGHAGTKIQLQRKKGGEFKTIASKKLNLRCRARFKIEANFRFAIFRSKWPKQDADHRAGLSRNVSVKTHR